MTTVSPPEVWHWSPGTPVNLGVVFIDRVGSTAESAILSPQAFAGKQAQYQSGVEEVARAYGACDPLGWQGDGATIFLHHPDPDELPRMVARAGRDLWQRCRIDLGIPVRLAGHVMAAVEWNPEPGMLASRELNVCGHLEKDAPPGTFVVSEDVYLALVGADQAQFKTMGTSRDGLAAYVFPAAGTVGRASDNAASNDELHVWERFRNYCFGSEIAMFRYVGFRLQKKEPPVLPVTEIFVLPTFETEGETEGTSLAAFLAGAGLTGARPRIASLAELLRNPSLVVLGEPGAGKTAILRWLAVIAARGRFALQSRFGLDERRLPLPVSVGRLAELRGPSPNPGSVLRALALYFEERLNMRSDRLESFLEAALSKGECLVLFDGLDEVARDNESVLRWIESFASVFPRNRYVASSRIVGYRGLQLPQVREARLTPFSDAQIQRYLTGFNRAYHRLEGASEDNDRAADAATAALLGAIQESPRLAAVAKNPFLLSALALIHRSEGRLPRHRIVFYQTVARTLCETWGSARRLVAGDSVPALRYEEEALPILGELAIEMHRNHPTAAAPKKVVLRALAKAVRKQQGLSVKDANKAAEAFLEKSAKEVGLLCERGPGLWGFLHLTFQEFFVAAGLHANERFTTEALKNMYEPRWEEVIRLGVGYLAIVQGRLEGAAKFVRKVHGYQAPEAVRWISTLLEKQVPLAALLASDVGEALDASTRKLVFSDFFKWVMASPPSVAGRFLREVGMNGTPDVREGIARHLGDPNPEVIAKASWIAGQFGDEILAPLLLTLVKHDDAKVRAAAIAAVARPGNSLLLPILNEHLRNDPDLEVRKASARALGRVADPRAIPLLEQALSSADVAFQAASAMTAIDLFAALTRFVKRTDLEPASRVIIMGKLLALSLADEDEFDVLVKQVLSDPTEAKRTIAVRALYGSSDERFLPVLEQAFTDSSYVVRFWALNVVADMSPALDRIRSILEGALSDPDDFVRARAIRSLAERDSSRAADELTKMRTDFPGSESWWWAATRVFALQAATTAIPALLSLRDAMIKGEEDPTEVVEALWRFSEIGPRQLPHSGPVTSPSTT